MGSYSQITELSAVSPQVQGATVPVEIGVKNVYSGYLTVHYFVNTSTGLLVINRNIQMYPDQTIYELGFFTMPAQAVTLTAEVWYVGGDGNLYFDERRTLTIQLQGGGEPTNPVISNLEIQDFVKV